jgi:hypothetical protein
MKTLLVILLLTMFWINSQAQQTIDTTDIVTSYNTNEVFVKSYHVKNQNHFAKSDNSSYYHEIDGEVSLSDNSRKILSEFVIEVLQKDKQGSYSGKTIWLHLIVNFKGEITSVMIGLKKEDASSIDFTKQEVKQIMQKIKKNVQFDVEREFKYKDRFISMSVPVRIK